MKDNTLNTIDLQGSINIPHLWKGILDSYHNYYDIFSELIQNSVDSVRRSNNENPEIQISFDNSTQKIVVRDNGIGMSENDLKFFALGNTNKSEDNKQIGEKGLGASFILGISDIFKLKSIKNGVYIEAECLDANKDIRTGKIPTLTYKTSSEKTANFCEIEVAISSIDINIDDVNEFIFILRTRTALGNTNNLFLEEEDREKIDINYTFTNINRVKNEGKIPFLYLHFDELVKGEYPIFDAFYIKRSKKWTIDASEVEKKPRGILRLIDYDNKIYVTFGQYQQFSKFYKIAK